jgi:hypothetical protein
MTMLKRWGTTLPPHLVSGEVEMRILDQLESDPCISESTLLKYVLKVAKLGDDLTRSSDPLPGNTIISRNEEAERDPNWIRAWKKTCGLRLEENLWII